MRIGLMGGTYDPIHIGHLFIAEEARVRCSLDEVIFFPNYQPPHREGKFAEADAETRYELMCLAIADNPHFRPSRVELDRPGPSFAIDTIAAVRAQYHEEAELFFIIGSDSLLELPTWHRSAELFEACSFIVAMRPGAEPGLAAGRLTPQQMQRVHSLESPPLDIASRDLRRRVREGLPIRYLVPAIVEREIYKRGLYVE